MTWQATTEKQVRLLCRPSVLLIAGGRISPWRRKRAGRGISALGAVSGHLEPAAHQPGPHEAAAGLTMHDWPAIYQKGVSVNDISIRDLSKPFHVITARPRPTTPPRTESGGPSGPRCPTSPGRMRSRPGSTSRRARVNNTADRQPKPAVGLFWHHAAPHHPTGDPVSRIQPIQSRIWGSTRRISGPSSV